MALKIPYQRLLNAADTLMTHTAEYNDPQTTSQVAFTVYNEVLMLEAVNTGNLTSMVQSLRFPLAKAPGVEDAVLGTVSPRDTYMQLGSLRHLTNSDAEYATLWIAEDHMSLVVEGKTVKLSPGKEAYQQLPATDYNSLFPQHRMRHRVVSLIKDIWYEDIKPAGLTYNGEKNEIAVYQAGDTTVVQFYYDAALWAEVMITN